MSKVWLAQCWKDYSRDYQTTFHNYGEWNILWTGSRMLQLSINICSFWICGKFPDHKFIYNFTETFKNLLAVLNSSERTWRFKSLSGVPSERSHEIQSWDWLGIFHLKLFRWHLLLSTCVVPPTPSLWWTGGTPHTELQNGSDSLSHSRGRHPWERR